MSQLISCQARSSLNENHIKSNGNGKEHSTKPAQPILSKFVQANKHRCITKRSFFVYLTMYCGGMNLYP